MKYSIIYADPPWKYLWGEGKEGGHFAPEKHYPTLSVDELCEFDVKAISNKNSVLALWATSPCLPDAIKVMNSWGFKYKTVLFVWIKQNPRSLTVVTGPGSYTRSAAEYILLGMRGHIKRISTEVIPQVVFAPRGRHSEKPGVFRDYLISLFGDLPRVELFARYAAPGWDVFGNEVQNSIDVPRKNV
jgi:N6-adenosine-specific RNA methylase IME4